MKKFFNLVWVNIFPTLAVVPALAVVLRAFGLIDNAMLPFMVAANILLGCYLYSRAKTRLVRRRHGQQPSRGQILRSI